MKMPEIRKKLAAFGVKLPAGAPKGVLLKELEKTQANKALPGHNIGQAAPKPGDRI